MAERKVLIFYHSFPLSLRSKTRTTNRYFVTFALPLLVVVVSLVRNCNRTSCSPTSALVGRTFVPPLRPLASKWQPILSWPLDKARAAGRRRGQICLESNQVERAPSCAVPAASPASNGTKRRDSLLGPEVAAAATQDATDCATLALSRLLCSPFFAAAPLTIECPIQSGHQRMRSSEATN